MSSYNLVTEKWIPCVLLDGKPTNIGLHEILRASHEIREIFDPSPLITSAIHRLLLVILHRNFGPANLGEWEKCWNKGLWDEDILNDYFRKWHSRFDLFDNKYPFYQCHELSKVKKHPIQHLAMEASSGNNVTLFDHSNDDNPAEFSPAKAARYLIATQAYSIGFGRSTPFNFRDSPLIRGLSVMVLGNTLFETLALNFIIYNKQRPFQQMGNDCPAWELDEPVVPNKDGSPIKGYLDYLTWQSRSVHLFPEGNPLSVQFCQIQQNLRLPEQEYFDPFKCYRKNEERGFVQLNINPKKALWRDSHSLFQTTDHSFKRPELINFLARIRIDCHDIKRKIQPAYWLAINGLATESRNPANVLLWRQERLPLPLKYLEDEDLIDALKNALELANDIAKSLNNATLCLATQLIAPDTDIKKINKAQKNVISGIAKGFSPMRSYWATLGVKCNNLLLRLPDDKAVNNKQVIYGEKVIPWWVIEARNAAYDSFELATQSLERSARSLKAASQAESLLRSDLNLIVKPYLDNKSVQGGNVE